VDGEARRPRREARDPDRRLALGARAACAAFLAACASVGEPPGGPPDTTPPTVDSIAPDSGAVLTAPPGEATVFLSEVVNERIAAPRPDVSGAVLLSPVKGRVTVTWRRNRVSVEPREGFRPGRVYRLEVFPVFTDLRQNRMKRGGLSVFSTGPAIPTAVLTGALVDWPGNRPGANGLVEAVLLPDSLPYRTLADSTGSFTLRQVPPGEYLVYATVDQDNNRARGPREAFDSVRVTLGDSAAVEVFAFPHDTTGPRLRTVELADSLTLKLTFDRALDPGQALDTVAVALVPVADSTARLPVLDVWTPAQADSIRARAAAAADSARRRAADSVRTGGRADSARTRGQADSARTGGRADSARTRGQADSVRTRGHADSARTGGRADSARAQAGMRPPPLAPATATPGARAPAGAAQTPRDSSLAMKMLARRPSPSAVRLVRLAAPLPTGARYAVTVLGVRGLSGPPADARGQISVAVPRLRAQTGRAGARGDTLRNRGDTLSARADTLRAHADSTRPAPPPPPPPSR